jgi:hypothetical protein
MEYRVIPFTASLTQKDSAAKAAAQLEALIAQQAAEKWEYVRLESVETFVAGTGGCFSTAENGPKTISISMAVFKR